MPLHLTHSAGDSRRDLCLWMYICVPGHELESSNCVQALPVVVSRDSSQEAVGLQRDTAD